MFVNESMDNSSGEVGDGRVVLNGTQFGIIDAIRLRPPPFGSTPRPNT
jgi:hypothetical protein